MSNSEQPFSTTFTVREHLLAENIGVQAVSQVMGTVFLTMPRNKRELLACVYGPGFASKYNPSFLQPVVGEIPSLTSLRLDARQKAIDRMAKEAERLGASGVVAARLKTAVHNWGDCLTLECTAIGTAVDVPGWSRPKPFTSLLSVQQFWRLWQSGYQPIGIAIGACSYSDCVEVSVLERTRNQEVGAYTVSFYDAHELAMKAFTKDVKELHGIGAVGVEVDFEFEDLEKDSEVAVGVELKYMHLLTHFVIVGTALERRPALENANIKHQRTLRILELSGFKTTSAEGREFE